ncbi:MAG: integration host factor subunit beta [Nitrospirae bacterium]|nr:integration host factor subunit beta [Nitrospirota bacterium]
MTRSLLIEHVAEKVKDLNLSKKEVEVILETVFDNIKEALAKGDKVEVRGFGNFRLRKRNPRQARNPKTGASVAVDSKKVPFFKVGKELREMVNRGL